MSKLVQLYDSNGNKQYVPSLSPIIYDVNGVNLNTHIVRIAERLRLQYTVQALPFPTNSFSYRSATDNAVQYPLSTTDRCLIQNITVHPTLPVVCTVEEWLSWVYARIGDRPTR